jgi:hypothetical protein
MNSLVKHSKILKAKNDLPVINSGRSKEVTESIINHRKPTNTHKYKVLLKLPSCMNNFIDKLKRDFSIAEHSTFENIRISNKNNDMMNDLKKRQYVDRVSYLKREKELFKKGKSDAAKICNTWDGVSDEESKQKCTLPNNIILVNKPNVDNVLRTIDDISNNLYEINRKILDKGNNINKTTKKVKLQYDLMESDYHPLQKTGLPIFVKKKFNKRTIANYNAITGKSFGGSSVR